MTMPAGKYYIGDLCYVMSDVEWKDVCETTIDGSEVKNGEFTLSDGRRIAIYSTAVGDGCYECSNYRDHYVDSGTIGCILYDDIRFEKDKDRLIKFGSIVTFDEPFETSVFDDSLIIFGNVEIETAPEYNEYDDWDEEEDEY